MMTINIDVIGKKYIMEITHGGYQGTHAGSSIQDCLEKAKKIVRKSNYNGKVTFRVVNHGHDANGSPITELIAEADG